MTLFASDVCEISGNTYSALIHGERNMAVIAHSCFQTGSLPLLNYLRGALIEGKQEATFKMYLNTLISDFKFFK